jgi:hypothetical protein
LRTYLLDQQESTYAQGDGSTSTLPASRSYEVRGSMSQLLPGGLRARARIDYFSDITTMQTFNMNVQDASRVQRSFNGNVAGAWRGFTLNGTYDRSEYFSGTTSSALYGGAPRVAVSRSERPLLGSPIYFSVGGEYAHLLRVSRNLTTTPIEEDDRTLTRLNIAPQIRYPFKKWQWFTVSSTLGWRDTYYTRSLDPTTKVVLDDGLNRRFFLIQSRIVGPAFNRIWDTPGNRYAEKFKHSVEPYLSLDRTSTIDNFDQIVQIEPGVDAIVGGTTRATYGVNNRFYAKRRRGQTRQAREIIGVDLTQTYYTDQRAAQYDPRYETSLTGAPPSHFSPIALSVRVVPTNDLNFSTRAEFDSRYRALRTITASGTYAWTGRLQTTFGWSKRAFIEELAGFNDKTRLDHYINAGTNVHTKDNQVGGAYAFNYDVLRASMLQQRLTGFYNAQCCGVAFEYQAFSFGGITSVGGVVPTDHRFFLSFTLGGLGSFSPFSGAMGGVPR